MVDPHNIEGCEDLLESYFMQVSCRSQSLLAVPHQRSLLESPAVGGSEHCLSCVSMEA